MEKGAQKFCKWPFNNMTNKTLVQRMMSLKDNPMKTTTYMVLVSLNAELLFLSLFKLSQDTMYAVVLKPTQKRQCI
jgi:hypothetical protein